MGRLPDFRAWEIDIDIFLNRYVPHPHFHRYPRPIAHFLGHRPHPIPKIGNVLVMLWSFIGVFCGLLIVTAVSRHIPSFRDRDAPLIVGSFGAAAVLAYCAIESPLAQPRNAIVGHVISAVAGVAITKLFDLHPNHENLYWIAGPLACAVATLLMAFTKTVHPPAGATALLAAVDPTTRQLEWFLIPVILLCSTLVLVTALIFNNIQRSFPTHWWTPESLLHKVREEFEFSSSEDIEQARPPTATEKTGSANEEHIVIKQGQVTVSDSVSLSPEEREFLENLSKRI